jgi:signal transduction histidine kinase
MKYFWEHASKIKTKIMTLNQNTIKCVVGAFVACLGWLLIEPVIAAVTTFEALSFLQASQLQAKTNNDVSIIVTAMIISGIFIILAVWAFLKQIEANEKTQEAAAAAYFRTLMLQNSPGGFLTLHGDGTCFCSERLREWLNLEEAIFTLQALTNKPEGIGLTEKSLATLKDIITMLSQNEGTIKDTIRTKDGRILRVKGTKLSLPEVDDNMLLLWFSDITLSEDINTKLEKELRQIRAWRRQLEGALGNLPQPAWLATTEGDLEWVNQAYCDAVDIKSPLDVLKTQSYLAELDDKDKFLMLRNHGIFTQDTRTVIKGERKAVRFMEMSSTDSRVKNQLIFGMGIDRSEVDDLEHNISILKKSQTEILNRLTTPVAIFNTSKHLEFFNHSFANLWSLPINWLSEGPEHGELLEKLREKRLLPEQADFRTWKKNILNQYTSVINPVEEMWHLPNSSTLRIVTQPHPSGGLIILFEDVTDKLALERSYNTLIAVQNETLNNLQEGIALVGSDGLIKLSNDTFASTLNLSPAAITINSSMMEIMDLSQGLFAATKTKWEKVKNQFIAQMEKRETVTGTWFLTDDRHLQFTLIPLPDGAHLVTVVDITATLRIEKALRERAEALETADNLKSEFVANVSYELRTPLNSIIGFSELLQNEIFGDLNDRQLEYISSILSASNTLRSLIDDILDMAVLDAGKMVLDIDEFDLKAGLNTVLKMVHEPAQRAGLKIQPIMDEKIKPIQADSRRIQHALYSLITNAFNFSKPGDKIIIEAKPKGKNIIVTLINENLSLKEPRYKKLFDDFMQVTRDAGPIRSTNISLSLVRNFIELHGGSVSVMKKLKKGVGVQCTIPKIAKQQPEEPFEELL